MKLILLTHARETLKPTNTGRLVQAHIVNCRTVIWQRTQPDVTLLRLIREGNVALVYPSGAHCSDNVCSDNGPEATDTPTPEYFILIDSTWQQARKIFNRSAYLQNIPRIQLTSRISSYHLRRNQIENGLCTAECAIELLRAHSCNPEVLVQVEVLEQAFKAFIT